MKEVSSWLWLEAPGFFHMWMSSSPLSPARVSSWHAQRIAQLSFHPCLHQECHRSCLLGGNLGMIIHISELRRSMLALADTCMSYV